MTGFLAVGGISLCLAVGIFSQVGSISRAGSNPEKTQPYTAPVGDLDVGPEPVESEVIAPIEEPGNLDIAERTDLAEPEKFRLLIADFLTDPEAKSAVMNMDADQLYVTRAAVCLVFVQSDGNSVVDMQKELADTFQSQGNNARVSTLAAWAIVQNSCK